MRLDPDARREQARRGPRGLSVSFGDPLPERVVRGIVLARLATFLGGHAAVRPAVAEAVAGMLDGRALPAVPSRGNGGSGEIIALGWLFAGLTELGLEEKESLALVNGSPCSSALVADAALAARGRLALCEEVLALAAEAVRAPHDAYAEELDDLWGDEHETAALARLRSLLGDGEGERRPYQAPVSFRIAPRVLGQARRSLVAAERVAAMSLRAVSDNPVFVPPRDGHRARILSNGSYHNAQAPAALDGLAAAWPTSPGSPSASSSTSSATLPGRTSAGPESSTRSSWCRLPLPPKRTPARRTPLVATGAAQNDVSSPSFVAWRSERKRPGRWSPRSPFSPPQPRARSRASTAASFRPGPADR